MRFARARENLTRREREREREREDQAREKVPPRLDHDDADEEEPG